MQQTRSYMRRVPIQEIVHCITRHMKPGHAVLVGIDGGAGSGKTTFSRWFAEQLHLSVDPVSVVLTDRIYRPVADRWAGAKEDMPIGYDLDWERMRDEVILPLRAGRMACFRIYDWVADRLDDWIEIDARGVTIIDGVFALRNELANQYDLRIWFSCPEGVRVSRLLNRGDTPQAEIDYWIPIEQRYHAAHAPETSAHLVLDSTADIAVKDGSGGLKVLRWMCPLSTFRAC